MASPQKENGHLDLANELVEILAKTELNGGEFRILFAVWRKTYCWHKKEDWISLSQLEEMTGFSHWYVSKIKQLLVSKRLLVMNGLKVAFNKDYSQWVSNSLLVSNRTTGSKQQNNLLVSNSLHTKENMFSKRKIKLKKTMNDLLESGELGLGDFSKTGTPSPLDVKIEKKHQGSDFGRMVISLGYGFDERYFKREGLHFKGGTFSVSGIVKNISKYKQYKKENWDDIMDKYFASDKAKDLTITLEACFSENTIMAYQQGKLISNKKGGLKL